MSKQDSVIQQKACESVAHIPLRVSTPISLKPCIRKLPISAKICGDPQLTPTPCGTYILTQNLCVRVPIEIDIKSKIGNPRPHCNNSTNCKKPFPTNYKNIGTPNVVIGSNSLCYRD